VRLTSFILIFSLLTQIAFGDNCDWTKIVKNNNDTFTYSKTLHVCVGTTVQDNKVKTQQIKDLTKALSMSDLALQDADKRTQNWSDTASKLEDRVQKIDSLEKHNEAIYFGLGFLAACAAAWMASRLIR
jgi:hypothetical protein